MVEAMADACSFAEQAEPLAELSKHQRAVVNLILQQVIECAYFIKAYCKDSFGMFSHPNLNAGRARN